MRRFQGPIARQLILTFAGLALVAVAISIGAVYAVQYTDSILQQVQTQADLLTLSARVRSESLALTDLVRRYIADPRQAEGIRERIDTQEEMLDQLILQAMEATNPEDVNHRKAISEIRQYLFAFSSQVDRVLQAYDTEQSAGEITSYQLTILVQNYQDPLIRALEDFEETEAEHADLIRHITRQAVQTTTMTLAGVGIVILAIVLTLVRLVLLRIITPLARLRKGVNAIQYGRFDEPIEIGSQDEMGELARALNSMAAEVADSRQKLEAYAHTLEEQVQQRTREAEQRAQQASRLSNIAQNRAQELERRALQAQTAVEISNFASGTLDQAVLLQHSVNLIRERFGMYYVGLFLLDDTGQFACLRSGTGEAAEHLLANHHKLPIDNTSLTGWTIKNRQSKIVADVAKEPLHYHNPLLPGTRSEAVLPLVSRGEVIGSLTVQSDRVDAFQEQEVAVLQTMTAQLANAITNARLYQGMQREKLAAEAANNAKSVFLANMSHEIRTPLNAILGFTELLQRDENLTPSQRSNINVIHRSGEMLLSLINNILDLSKIEAGRMTMNEQVFSVRALLANLEEMFRLRAADRGLTLTFVCEEDVPNLLRTDESKLRQVLLNLLGNALKFTASGKVEVRVTQVFKGAPALIRFSVEDSGAGISPDEIQMIFEPFTQASSGRKIQQGTGLGLAISSQLVELLGGKLDVESTLGEGSKFSFAIPVYAIHASEAPVQRRKHRIARLMDGQPVYRLLVVDSQPEGREWILGMLERLGFQVKEASSGQEALELWESWHPHLIWMDWNAGMPDLDGREAARRIKATPEGWRTIIVAMTASTFDEDHEQMLQIGCDDSLLKPVSSQNLIEQLERHLGVVFVETGELHEPQPILLSQDDLSAAWKEQSREWLSELRTAAGEADFVRVQLLVDRIRASHPSLAEALDALVNNFDVRGLLAILPPTRVVPEEGQTSETE
jgi:signal transduction histidine kinase/DNA-binding response OmpR family regulator/methyl-accepting chemotaxis protein